MSAVLISLGLVSAMLMWIDIINISENVKKTILCILLFYACVCGCYAFPDSADFLTYLSIYYLPASDSFDFQPYQISYLDYGFLWFWTLIKSFGGDIYTAYFITCIVSLYLYYESICRYTKYYFCAWAFILVRTFYISNIVQIRQGLGSAILLYSLRYVEESCFFKFLFCVVIAASFHQSFILAIFIYPLGKINWTKEKCIFSIMIMLIASATNISSYFFDAIQLAGVGADKIASYSGTSFFQPISLSDLLFRLLMAMIGIFYVLKYEAKYKDIFVGMLVTGCAITLFFSSYYVLGRLANNFLLCLPFAISLLFYNDYRLNGKIFIMLMLNIVFIVLLVKNYINVFL